MLSRHTIILILVCAAYVVALFVWSSFGFPTIGQICKDAANSTQPNCTTHYLLIVIGWNVLWWIGDNTNTLTVIGTFALAAFVLVQVIDARKSNERQLRAYLMSVVGGGIRQGGKFNLKFEFRPIILNTGQTPAYDVHIMTGMKFLSFAEAATFDFRLKESSENISLLTLGPRQDKFTQTILDRKLSRAELREYKLGKRRLYVYGTVYYRDAFKKRRYTNYCYVVSWWVKPGGPIWHNTNRHNESN